MAARFVYLRQHNRILLRYGNRVPAHRQTFEASCHVASPALSFPGYALWANEDSNRPKDVQIYLKGEVRPYTALVAPHPFRLVPISPLGISMHGSMSRNPDA
jgi:hypothetical protein